MDKENKITVLLTVYNSEKFLRESIESILSQTFNNFEFLIINDGSKDHSSAIIQQYAAKDTRIKVIHKEKNEGLVRAKNDGMQHATGKFLALMDSDDISLPDRLQKQYDFLESHPCCVAVGTKTILIDPQGDPLCIFPVRESHEEIDAFHISGKGGGMIQPSVMLRLDSMKKLGGFREKYPHAEDFDYFLRAAESGGRLANIPEVLFKYRQHLNSIGYAKQQLQQEQTFECTKEAHKRRKLPFTQVLIPDINHKTSTTSDHYRKWGWWALGSGYIHTARKYAIKTALGAPFSKESWRLLFCSLRGY